MIYNGVLYRLFFTDIIRVSAMRECKGYVTTMYHHFSNEGYHVIIPLRRGVIGLSSEWEQELYGRYGIADVEDILSSTREFVMEFEPTVDSNRLGLYGASYGGTLPFLIKKHIYQ